MKGKLSNPMIKEDYDKLKLGQKLFVLMAFSSMTPDTFDKDRFVAILQAGHISKGQAEAFAYAKDDLIVCLANDTQFISDKETDPVEKDETDIGMSDPGDEEI